MAIFSGTAGQVTFSAGGEKIEELREWSLDLSQSAVDVSSFSKSWTESISGIRNFSGSFSGNFSDETHQSTALNDLIGSNVGVFVRLRTTFLTYFSGTVFLTGSNPSVSYDGAVQTTYSFVGKQSIVFATS